MIGKQNAQNTFGQIGEIMAMNSQVRALPARLLGLWKVRFERPKRVMPISTYTLILRIWKAIIKSSFMSRLSHKHCSAAITPDS